MPSNASRARRRVAHWWTTARGPRTTLRWAISLASYKRLVAFSLRIARVLPISMLKHPMNGTSKLVQARIGCSIHGQNAVDEAGIPLPKEWPSKAAFGC